MSRSLAERIADFSRVRLALLCTELDERLSELERSRTEPIAIVGMGCRFPGGSNDPDSYWRMLAGGVDAIREIPPDRWDLDEYYDPDPEAPGKMYCRHGGFLDRIDLFDPQFFNLSPRETESLDPQHRLLLEVTWEALENAGLSPAGLKGSKTGIFIGFGADDYAKLQVRSAAPESVSAYTGTGNAYCYGAGRLSFVLGAQGPNFPVDTACSSSLVAAHLACQSLRLGESDLAIVGGVHLMISPVGSIFLSKARALAPDGRCKTFDASADGYSRGEGCGVVVLARLRDALARALPVHAVIRGSAINHDGPASGFTVPNGPAQQAVIQSALASGGVAPQEIDYVEVHGTGTSLGDPIEVRSLAAALGKAAGRPADRPLVIGSVKTNIGHLEPAAGVAGLIKVVLALKNEAIPAHLHFREVNPHIALDAGPFEIPTELRPWPRGERPRRAGLSSFGLSGTNSHLVIEEAPAVAPRPEGLERPLHVLALSARDEASLAELATRHAAWLETHPAAAVGDVCATLNAGRATFTQRLTVLAATTSELAATLRKAAAGQSATGLELGKARSRSRPKVAFLFTGQGAQYRGMGRELYDTQPVFRQALDACAAQLDLHLDRPLLPVLWEEAGPLDETGFTQPALFAFEYALAELWRSWGVEPIAMLGHSVGEYAAACLSGVFSLETAARLIATRARSMQALPTGGAMAAVFASRAVVEAALHGSDQVSVAAWNGPESAVLSGPAAPLEDVLAKLAAAGTKSRRLEVSHAFHSALMEPVLAGFEQEVAASSLAPPGSAALKAKLVSCVSGKVAGAELATPGYWRRQLREPVEFAAGVATLAELGCDVFLEIGPQPTLVGMAKRCLPEGDRLWLPSVRPQQEWRELLATVAALWRRGTAVDWEGFEAPYARRRLSLPTYPFQRQRYWVDLAAHGGEARLLAESEVLADPSLGSALRDLVCLHGDDGTLAINRRVTAPLVFWSGDRRSVFFCNQKGSALLASLYCGPDERYGEALAEIDRYATERGLDLTLFGTERRAEALASAGFSTTPLGVWQSLPDLAAFTLEGGSARPLRSKVSSYRNQGAAFTEEHQVGRDSERDREIVALMKEWVARKGRKAPFVSLLEDEILSGRLDAGYRLFRVGQGDRLDAVILLTPIPAKRGYLMDLEFYRANMPSGALEFGIVSVLEVLRQEGSRYYSLGSTFGTQLVEHPNADPRVAEILHTFHAQGILNEDGNFNFKKKFHPVTTSFYLARRRGAETATLPEVLVMVADPSREPLGARPASADPLLAGRAAYRDELRRRVVHPLAGRRLPLALRQVVFEAELDLELEPLAFLEDHRIFGRPVLPATGYLEAVTAAAARAYPERSVELLEVELREALVWKDRLPRRSQVVLTPEGPARASFQLVSNLLASGGEEAWTLHAVGAVGLGGEAVPVETEGLETIFERCSETMSVEAYYEQIREFGIDYGAGFQALEELRCGYGEALGRIRLPAALAAGAGAFRFHPALLDACVQVHGAALLSSRDEQTQATYLPVRIGSFRSYRDLPSEVLSHVRIRPTDAPEPEVLLADVRILDLAGELLAELQGFEVRRTNAEVFRLLLREAAADVYYEMQWQPAVSQAEMPATVAGAWLVLGDCSGVGATVAAELAARGAAVVAVEARAASSLPEGIAPGRVAAGSLDPHEPDSWKALLDALAEAGLPLEGVLHLWSLDCAGATSLPELLTAQDLGCRALLGLVQAIALAERPPRLWVATRGAQALPSGAAVDLCAAPLGGLGRSIAQEHPELWGGLLDLELGGDPRQGASALLQEVLGAADEDHVAWRNGERWVARLRPAAPVTGLPSAPRAGGTHLITGGLGGLGLAVARHLVAQGAKRLALVGRRGPSVEVERQLEELRRSGAEVSVHAADIADPRAVEQLFAHLAEEAPPVVGIVHAAGVLADGALLQQDWSRFETVFAPKLAGAWNLHQASAGLALDYFVLFSSTASLFGAAGQGNYAAANAFLDALAHHRRAGDLPALAVAWGPWAEVGMSASLGSRAEAQRAAHGIGALPPAQGLEALDRLLADPRVVARGVIVVDWERLLESAATALRRSSLFRELATFQKARGGGSNALLESLQSESPATQTGLVETYLAQRVAAVLRLEESAIDREESLNAMGFDSLMALELRERIEAETRVTIPVINLFRGDNLVEIAAYLLDQLRLQHPDLGAAATSTLNPEALLEQLDELSDEQVAALLQEMLPS